MIRRRGHRCGRSSESGSAHRAVDFRLYTKVAVDHIARDEQLPTELERIVNRLGLPAGAIELPRVESGLRPDRLHYSELYTPEERDFVMGLFADEIALHGYRDEELKDVTLS